MLPMPAGPTSAPPPPGGAPGAPAAGPAVNPLEELALGPDPEAATTTTPSKKPKAPKVLLGEVQSEHHRELAMRVQELFGIAKSHRRPLIGRWKANYRMLWNRYWTPDSRPSWMPSPQISEIFPIAASTVGWMFDQPIGHTIAPAALPHSEFAEFFQNLADDLETTLAASFQVNEEESEWTQIGWDGVVYGTGIGKTCWDPHLAGGLGDAKTERVDPFCLYPDPAATNFEDGNFFIEARVMSIQELDRRYPGAADIFKQGGVLHDVDKSPTHITFTGDNDAVKQVNPGAMSPATTPSYFAPGSARISAIDLPGVTVLEAWIREHTISTVTDIRSGDETKRAHDGWRVVVVAGNHVLMDEPAENLWDHGGHPYSRFCPFDMGEFWGMALVDLLSSPQKALNRLLAALQQNVELTGNPIWKETATSGLNRQTMQNRPGQRMTVPLQGAADTGWVNPPNVHPMMMDLIKYLLSRMEAISGLAAVTKGQSSGRASTGVVDAMQESSFVRIRMMLRNLETALRDAGTKKASLIIQNYTEPRVVAIAGPQGETTMKALRGRHFMIPSNDGHVPLKYQLLVDAGSRRHTSRGIREDRAVQLFTLGAIDRRALLDDVDYPNAAAIASRLDERDAQMAAAGEQVGPGTRQRARA